MTNRINTLVALTALTLGLAASAAAQTYYTVDVTEDVLYKIDVVTGVATAIGSIGTNVDNVALTWMNGALYAKSQSTVSGTRIFQIVTTGAWAGAGLAGSTLNGGGWLGASVEGFTSAGGSLILTYSTSPPTNFWSGRMSTVNPISGAINPSGVNVPLDADGLGYVLGQFYAIDVINPGGGCVLYAGPASPSTYVGGMSYDTTLHTNPVDIEFFDGTWLVAMGQTGRRLVRVNRFTGARGATTTITGIPSDAKLAGLARDPGCGTRIWIPIH